MIIIMMLSLPQDALSDIDAAVCLQVDNTEQMDTE